MIRAVATHFMLTYLILVLALWFFMDQASNLVLPWETSSAMVALVEVLFDLYTQTTVYTCIIFSYILPIGFVLVLCTKDR